MQIVTVQQMLEIEAASDAAGHSYAAMMEQAGRAVAQALPNEKDRRILVLVGPGNNGGDGLVAARYLAQAGAEVACYLARPRDPDRDPNLRRMRDLHVFCTAATDDEDLDVLRKLVTGTDVLIDALLGTGTELPVRGAIAQVLRVTGEIVAQRRRAERPALIPIGQAPDRRRRGPLVLAVDGPTGLDFDTGALDEASIAADLTVTFAYPKRGHFGFPGASAVGQLLVADIGIDPALAPQAEIEVVTAEMARAWLPTRPRDGHKGTFGRALIVAGSTNYTGAARLAGAAAARAGAGLVTLALPAPIQTAVAAGLPEATYLLLPHELGVIDRSAAAVLAAEMGRVDALLLGPGLGQQRETAAFVEHLLLGQPRRATGFGAAVETQPNPVNLPPLVIDADGLNILARLNNWPARLPPQTILTPHPGEMSRLIDATIGTIQADRVDVARRHAQKWGHVVLLKGAYTVVAAPDGRVVLLPFANSGLATGGTGDVLAGIIVALRAQGLPAFEAAAAGVYLHGVAGELAAAALSAPGMTATDLLTFLPAAWLRMI